MQEALKVLLQRARVPGAKGETQYDLAQQFKGNF